MWLFMYSRSPKNPTLQLLQKSSKSDSTTPQRPIWNTFGTVAVRDFWEIGCKLIYHHSVQTDCRDTAFLSWVVTCPFFPRFLSS